MNRFQPILRRLLELCEDSDSMHAVIVIGSQARPQHPADEFSDLDLILLCAEPEKMLWEDEFFNQLGKIQYSFLEKTPLAGLTERRILFEGDLDVDFVPATAESLHLALETHSIDSILSRGYQVIYDQIGIADQLKAVSFSVQTKKPLPSEAEINNLINDFYYHAVWARKKVLRGELWTAKLCVDSYLKNRLLQMIEIYEKHLHGPDFDVWHNGRMLEQWAEPDIVQELKHCFAHYDPDDILTALNNTVALFSRLCRDAPTGMTHVGFQVK